MTLLAALLCASSGAATRALHSSDTLAKALAAVVAGGSSTGARQQQQPSHHVAGRSSATTIAPHGARLFSGDRNEPPAESSFLQSIDLSHPNAADRQKLSKLIQEVIKTKANTGGAYVRIVL